MPAYPPLSISLMQRCLQVLKYRLAEAEAKLDRLEQDKADPAAIADAEADIGTLRPAASDLGLIFCCIKYFRVANGPESRSRN